METKRYVGERLTSLPELTYFRIYVDLLMYAVFMLMMSLKLSF